MYYVNDRTVWIVLAAAVLFAMVGEVSMQGAWRRDGEPESSWRSVIFLVPLASADSGCDLRRSHPKLSFGGS